MKALAQKEYDQKVLRIAEKEQKILARLNRLYSNGAAEAVYGTISPLKQDKIEPIRKTDEQYVKQWMNEPYEGLEFREWTTEYYSEKGERMRSKSEVIIANMLNKFEVPYKYECPLLVDGRKIYPDFTVLNVHLRKELYWEHLGMMDNKEYCEKNLMKLTRYQLNGYFPGQQLILSSETSQTPINTKLVETLIKTYCIQDINA